MQFVDRLLARGVECVIIGGFAVNYYGYIRATEDIDLIYRRTPGSELALWETLCEFAAFWISNEIDAATGIEKAVPITLEYVRAQPMMMLGSNAGYIDLFDFLPGLESEAIDDLFMSAVESEGRKFVSLAWLKKLKLAAGRPQDRIDLDNLP